MKSALFALACLACLTPSALAGASEYDAENRASNDAITKITNALEDIGKVSVSADRLTGPMGRSRAPQADGELKLTGTFRNLSTASAPPMTSDVTLTTFNITLKIVGGKVVGVVATEEVRFGRVEEDIPNMAAAEKAAGDAKPSTRSWVYGPADFVAAHQGDIPRTDAKKAPSSIASETPKPKNGNDTSSSPKQELAVACNTVSPSSPGCP